MHHILGIENDEYKFGQGLEPAGVRLGFGVANIQSKKERLVEMVKKEDLFEKDDS